MNLDLKQPVDLRELIVRMAELINGFAKYAQMDSDSTLSAHVMFLRKGRPLRLTDGVEQGDRIDVVLPVTGG